MITRQADADHWKVKVDQRMPVGYLDFVIADCCLHECATRARWKWRQPAEEKPKRWDRALLEREREREKSSGFYRSGTCSSERRSRSQFGRTAVSSTSTAGQSSSAQPGDHTRHLRQRFSQEHWTCCAVTQRKNTSTRGRDFGTCWARRNVFFNDGVGPEGSVREISCLGNTSCRLQWSKGQCVQAEAPRRSCW